METVVTTTEEAAIAPKVARALDPIFERDVVSRYVNGRHSEIECSDAPNGAPFRAFIEKVIDRLLDECARVTRESQDLYETYDAFLDSALLKCVLDVMRRREELGFKCECNCDAPFKIIAKKGCEHHDGPSR